MAWFPIAAGALALVTVVAFGAATTLRNREHPNRAKENPQRIRMPRFVPFVGLAIVGCGLAALYSSIAHPEPDKILSTRLGATALFAIGTLFLWAYRNWFVDVRPDRVSFRRFGRRVKTIRYSDIVRYRVEDGNGSRSLMVRSGDGTVLHLNITLFDATPLLQHITRLEEDARLREAHEQRQRGAWGQQSRRAMQESQASGEPSKPSQKPVFIEGEVAATEPQPNSSAFSEVPDSGRGPFHGG